MQNRFNTYSEAAAFAKSQAQKLETSISLTRSDKVWIVESGNSSGKQDEKSTNKPQESIVVSQKPCAPENNPSLRLLKGYYLGRKIQQSRNKDLALRYINLAINAISTHDRLNEKILLYAVAEAECYRETDQAISKRISLKSLSNSIDNGETFSTYMSIESKTGTFAKVHGIQKGFISDNGVIDRSTWKDGFGNDNLIDYAANAAGVRVEQLSDQELNFLQRVSLLNLLKMDDIDTDG